MKILITGNRSNGSGQFEFWYFKIFIKKFGFNGFCDSKKLDCTFANCEYYTPTMKFHKIHSKEAIITWHDMPLFRYFDTFEFVLSFTWGPQVELSSSMMSHTSGKKPKFNENNLTIPSRNRIKYFHSAYWTDYLLISGDYCPDLIT